MNKWLFLPDCCRNNFLLSPLLLDDVDDDDKDNCWVSITSGVFISGCSRIFGTLPEFFSLEFKAIKRRWALSSILVGFIVISGCSKIRSSLWEIGLCRLFAPFFDVNKLLNQVKKEKKSIIISLF